MVLISNCYFIGGIGGSGGYVSSGNLTSGSYNVVIGSGGSNSSSGSATKIGDKTANGGETS